MQKERKLACETHCPHIDSASQAVASTERRVKSALVAATCCHWWPPMPRTCTGCCFRSLFQVGKSSCMRHLCRPQTPTRPSAGARRKRSSQVGAAFWAPSSTRVCRPGLLSALRMLSAHQLDCNEDCYEDCKDGLQQQHGRREVRAAAATAGASQQEVAATRFRHYFGNR